ncbi:MAG TPA: hypothetical protein VMH80_02290 [Bryobacteraceae bacterium]|nr:hypothetical protein [Bryobacteraceae bacterium]
MKRFHFVAGLLVAACLGLQAQTIDMHAHIPFNFQVSQRTFPAGDYAFHHSAGVLVVREEAGDHMANISFTVSMSRLKPASEGEVKFNRYGDYYFLEQLWTPGSQEGQGVLKSAREKEIAIRSGQQPAVVAILVK